MIPIRFETFTLKSIFDQVILEILFFLGGLFLFFPSISSLYLFFFLSFLLGQSKTFNTKNKVSTNQY